MLKFLAGLFITIGALHADTIFPETLTTVQTTVYDEATSGYVLYGPVTMQFTYDEQAYRYGVPVPIVQFSLPDFTGPSLYLYPHSGGFDGLDVFGTGSNGDPVVFGYAFAEGSLSTPGIHPRFGSGEAADEPILSVSGAPEPSSVGLFAITLLASGLFFRSSIARMFAGRQR